MMFTHLFDGINPEPWEAPIGSRLSNKTRAIHFHRTQKQKSYQEAIREDALALMDAGKIPNLKGPFKVRFFFWRTLDQSYDLTWSAKPADATNLQKATEDALQGTFFDNDRDVHDVQSVIKAQGPDVAPAVLVQFSTASLQVEYGWVDQVLENLRQANARKTHPSNIRPAGPDVF